jgi:raffinose/stachyose/melibiose transport system substrate-binding protein
LRPGEEVFKAGYLNPFSQLPSLTMGCVWSQPRGRALSDVDSQSAASAGHPDNLNDVGFFAIPGDDASKKGLTV